MALQVATRVDRQVAVVAAPFGAVAVETDAARIYALRFLPPTPEVAPSNDLAIEAVEQLKRYFADPGFRFDLPLESGAVPFSAASGTRSARFHQAQRDGMASLRRSWSRRRERSVRPVATIGCRSLFRATV